MLLADQPDDALRELRLCATQMPDFAPCQGSIVVAAIETGLIEEARAALAQMRDVMGLDMQCGNRITVTVEGTDEEAAVAAIQNYFVDHL